MSENVIVNVAACVCDIMCVILHKQTFTYAFYLLVWFYIDFRTHWCMWALVCVCKHVTGMLPGSESSLSAVKMMSRAGQGQFALAVTDRDVPIHFKAIFLHKWHKNQQMYFIIHNSLPQAQSVRHGTYSIIKLNMISYNNNNIIISYDPHRYLNKISQR